ncbi:PREDICTED: fucolectin-4-like [Branchiostoma belcheri]|uniref:Fucolectin-4-like n=1 Tax=Branchiostoma belcheri TaxID=7741 RepID=A0A6P4YIG4_BRABE|nr:PREDICTED: fucolectin-4-like [Branchiostoma belcheri]
MATQSSTMIPQYPAERAVDGNTGTTMYLLNECTHTHWEYEPWWKVDLGDTYVISHVTVINRGDCCGERLRNFMVRVGPYEDFLENTPCGDIYSETPSNGETIDVRCEEPISGRWVSVQLIGRKDVLSLCEVQVFAGTVLADNIAEGKPAFQTSVVWGMVAGLAVDGNTDTDYYHDSCQHNEGETNPMWVVIFNRMDYGPERLNPFNIQIGNSYQVTMNPKCGGDHYIDVSQPSISVSCQGMSGRYVGVRLPGYYRTLTLCEVQVYSN